jgi:hypothetical protein
LGFWASSTMKPDLAHFIAISRPTAMKNYYNLFGGLGIECGTKPCIGLREMILNWSKYTTSFPYHHTHAILV